MDKILYYRKNRCDILNKFLFTYQDKYFYQIILFDEKFRINLLLKITKDSKDYIIIKVGKKPKVYYILCSFTLLCNSITVKNKLYITKTGLKLIKQLIL